MGEHLSTAFTLVAASREILRVGVGGPKTEIKLTPRRHERQGFPRCKTGRAREA
jgi:hypothetical protein